jgi:hypothetical protein
VYCRFARAFSEVSDIARSVRDCSSQTLEK